MILFNGCLFVHIPKTGGTSLRTAMVQSKKACQVVRVRAPNGDMREAPNLYAPHMFLREARQPLGKLYAATWKFTIVRNPWDRYVSLYYFKGVCDPFPEWIDFILGQSYTQSKYLKDSFDFVGQLETIDVDWQTISQKLGMPHKALPILNKSERPKVHYSEMYTQAMVNKVASAERLLLKSFPYKFES